MQALVESQMRKQKEVEEAARLALRLNTTARLSLRKLQVALEASQMLEPRATKAQKQNLKKESRDPHRASWLLRCAVASNCPSVSRNGL